MEDNTLLRYSDLIAPDTSIDTLIALLGKVQSEYSALMQATKRYAADTATSMRKVNTTTKAGRDELARLTVLTDTLSDVIKRLDAGYDQIGNELLDLHDGTSLANKDIRALSAQIQHYQKVAMGMRNMREIFEVDATYGVVDDSFLQELKTLDDVIESIGSELNKYATQAQEAVTQSIQLQEVLDFSAQARVATDSLVSIKEALDDITAQYSLMDAEEKGSDRGIATKNNLDILRDAVTKLDAEIEPLVNKVAELIKAQQGLDFATSEEGKQVVALKQKIADLNKEMTQRAIIAEEVASSERALKAHLQLAELEWSKIPEAEQDSAQGAALRDRIKNLKTILADMGAKLKPAKAELTALEQAQQALAKATKDLEVALTGEGKQVVALKQKIAELNRETKLQAQVDSSEDGAYDQLKAQLKQATIAYHALARAKRDTTAEGRALKAQIIDLRLQLKAINDGLKATSASMSQDQIETEQAAIVTEKLAQAKAKLNVTRSQEYQELIQANAAQREANRIAKLQAQVDSSVEGSYERMAAQYELNKTKLKKLSLANRELTEDEKKLVAETYTLRNEMKKFQEMTGVHTLSVGDYGKVWDSFGFSIQQIVREMPAAAQGINNLFIAVSNNIPIFIDELMKLRKENDALIAQNRQDEITPIGKRIVSSIFSWQTALMGLLTVLTMYGDAITKWIKDLFKGKAAAISMKEAIRNINKELENSNEGYADSITDLRRLQKQWKELKNEAERTEWIKENKEEFENLCLVITDINEAEIAFEQRTKDIVKAYKDRARAAAAEKLAEEQYLKALQKEAEIEQAKVEGPTAADKRAANRYNAAVMQSGSDAPLTTAQRVFEQRIQGMEKELNLINKTADAYFNLQMQYEDSANAVLEEPDKESGGSGSEGSDLTDRIYRARLEARKKYEQSRTALIRDEYDRREAEAKASAEAEMEAQREVYRKAVDWRDDPENNYKDLTQEEQSAVQEIISKSASIIINTERKLNEDLAQLAIDRQIDELKIEEELLRLRLETVKEGSNAEIALRTRLLGVQRDIELKENEKTIKIIKDENAKAARDMSADFARGLWQREGFSQKAYQDAGGNWTVGPGFTEYTLGHKITEDTVITQEEAEKTLQKILNDTFIPELNAVLDEYGLSLNQEQYDAFLDLSYQGSTSAVRRVIEGALSPEKGLNRIGQIYADVGSQVGEDAAQRFDESFTDAYSKANAMDRMGLLLQVENLYTGGVIGGRDKNTGKTGVDYRGMQNRSDWRSTKFTKEPALELIEENRQSEANINAKYDKQLADLDGDWAIRQKEIAIEGIELKLQAVKEGSEEEYHLQQSLLDKQMELELKRNELLAENLQKDEAEIEASYERRKRLLKGQYEYEAKQQELARKRAERISGGTIDDTTGEWTRNNEGPRLSNKHPVKVSEYQLEVLDLEQEIALLELQIKQAGQGLLEWSPEQIKKAKAEVVNLKQELNDLKDVFNLIAKEGIGGGILKALNFDDESISAMQNAGNIIIEQLQAIADAEVEAAEKAVEAAEKRVDAAKSAYEAEIEARNNGYANNVATAKRELEEEKKIQAQKQKELQKAQRAQESINSAMQVSSLLTATAQLWAAFSGLGLLGQVLTLAAIATMWSSFTAAKVKARQVTSQTYGEGGLEFLEGGSHASGNDIDLGTTNSKGKRMRAEGGEAMAIINKKNTRKYKAVLPDIIDSLNNGNFEEKYLNSLNTSGLAISVNNATVDLSRIESDVADIKKQNETKYYVADGYLVIQHKNVKRIIKN